MPGRPGARLEADGLLLDMDGVLTVSWDPLPGAVAALAALRAAGMPLRVLTNTTSRSQARHPVGSTCSWPSSRA